MEDAEGVSWTQQCLSPRVYLDTFAIRDISESDELSKRFAGVILGKNGTWLISPLSAGEFANFEDKRHVASAEKLLAQVVPNIYFFDAGPREAWEEGDREEHSKQPLPSAHIASLEFFALQRRDAPTMADRFEGVFSMVHEGRDRLKQTMDETAEKLRRSLELNRTDPTYRAKAKAAKPERGRTRPQIISGDLLRDLILDGNAPITRNDMIDLMHAVDAVDHSDFVVLDGNWERRVNSLRKRIADSGLNMPVAKCYSQRANGIECCLQELENLSA